MKINRRQFIASLIQITTLPFLATKRDSFAFTENNPGAYGEGVCGAGVYGCDVNRNTLKEISAYWLTDDYYLDVNNDGIVNFQDYTKLLGRKNNGK